MPDPAVSIVAAAHNEQGNVSRLVREIAAVMDPAETSYELIVVDDGSTERTPAVLTEEGPPQRRLRGVATGRTPPGGGAGIVQFIGQIREIGVVPTMNIMVSGGVFNRADGLWKEVSADLVSKTAKDSLAVAEAAEPRIPEPPRVGPPKKRRRRRRPQVVVAAAE